MVLVMPLALKAQENVLDQSSQSLSEHTEKKQKLLTLNNEIRESKTAFTGSTLPPKTPSL